MNPDNIIIPLGILGYTFLTLALVTGILKFKFHVRWITFKMHMAFGVTAFLFATIHAVVVMTLD